MAQGGTSIEYNQNTNGIWWLFFQDSKILSQDSTGEYNVTRPTSNYTGTYPDNLWITDNFNGVVVATNNSDVPQAQYDATDITPTTQFADIAAWVTKSASATCKLIVAYKNFLVALNITEGQNYSNMVWWSDEADPGTLPANWDYDDPTSKSGRTLLGTSSGAIVGARRLRDALYIYCETGTYRMEFTGGRFVFRFSEVFKNSGIFGPRCVEEFEGKHFVITNSDIIIHDGHSQRTVGDSRVNRELFTFLNNNERNFTYVTAYPTLKEMWVAYSEDSSVDYPTKILAYQWQDDAWTKRAVPKARHMAFIPAVSDASTSSSQYSWADITGAWDENEIPWDATGLVAGDFRMFGLGGDLGDTVYEMDVGYEYPDSGYTYADTVAEISDINVTGDESVQMMISIYPRISGDQPIRIDIGGATTADGQYRWKEGFTFDPLTDYKISARIRGRRFAVRFKPLGPYPYRIEGYDILYEEAGAR